SGKFDTNDLVLTLGAFTYNILRWIGLAGLTGKASPVRHPAKRRRIRTVDAGVDVSRRPADQKCPPVRAAFLVPLPGVPSIRLGLPPARGWVAAERHPFAASTGVAEMLAPEVRSSSLKVVALGRIPPRCPSSRRRRRLVLDR